MGSRVGRCRRPAAWLAVVAVPAWGCAPSPTPADASPLGAGSGATAAVDAGAVLDASQEARAAVDARVDAGADAASSVMDGDGTVLIDHQGWRAYDAALDPLATHQPSVIECDQGWEVDAAGAMLDVETNDCNYLLLEHPAAIDVAAGSTLRTRLWHFDLRAREPDYVPSTDKPDDYRCFVVESPFENDTFVTGYDVRPGDLKTAHHAVIFYPLDPVMAEAARALDFIEEGPGYECFGSPGVPATIIGAWAPGAGATVFPGNLGVEVAAGRPLIIQMHYNTYNTPDPGSDSTHIDMQTQAEGASPALFTQLLDLEMSAPAGEPEAEVSFTSTVRMPEESQGKPIEVYGVFPHMHELGRELTVERMGAPEGADSCMVEVPRYDFSWQRLYFFDEPLRLEPDEEVRVRCQYDTTSRTEPVTWGEGTQDEMCVAGLLVKL